MTKKILIIFALFFTIPILAIHEADIRPSPLIICQSDDIVLLYDLSKKVIVFYEDQSMPYAMVSSQEYGEQKLVKGSYILTPSISVEFVLHLPLPTPCKNQFVTSIEVKKLNSQIGVTVSNDPNYLLPQIVALTCEMDQLDFTGLSF